MKSLRFLLLVLLLAPSAGRAQGSKLENAIKVIVHDSVVTWSQVNQLSEDALDTLRKQSLLNREAFERELGRAIEQNTKMLVERRMIVHEFEASGYQIPERVIDDLVEERIKARFADRITMIRTLKAQGMTIEKFKKQQRDFVILEIMNYKNVSAEVMISPKKVEAHYQQTLEKYKQEDEIKLRIITLKQAEGPGAPDAMKRAGEIREKLAAGAKFSELAVAYSQDEQARDGGDRGWLTRKGLRPEFADVAFQLKPGAVSDPVAISDPLPVGPCVYLLMVDEAKIAGVRPLSEVREVVERELLDGERTRLRQRWVDKLEKKTFVRYF